MEKLLIASQIIIALLLSFLILIQGKDEGFTASGGSGSFSATKRGPEKVLFIATVLLGGLFLLNALLFVFV